jgi:hypothetical protein
MLERRTFIMIKTKTQIVFDWEETGGIQIGDMYWVASSTYNRQMCVLTKVSDTCLYFVELVADRTMDDGQPTGKLLTEAFEVTVEDIADKKVDITHYDYEFTDLTPDEDE